VVRETLGFVSNLQWLAVPTACVIEKLELPLKSELLLDNAQPVLRV
jgi:hypothetical protein